VQPDGRNWNALAAPDERYRFCANSEHGCNWMVPASTAGRFCAACRHNRAIPDISNPANLVRWQKVETSKRRLVYSLINLGLPLPTVASGLSEPLIFDCLADPAGSSSASKVMTGHESGVITIALTEADDALREQNRVSMGEPYRTLLGHFRHEIGHFYWDKLVRDGGHIESCRAVFGDDRQDYAAPSSGTTQKGHPAAGRTASSAPMPVRTLGRISPTPLRITSISSIRWRQPAPSAFASALRLIMEPLSLKSILTLIAPPPLRSSSTLGCRSHSR
jgi:hypothetical protein